MKVKNLIGINAFQTAEKIYTVVKHCNEPGMTLELMIDKIHNFQTVGIEDKAFAKTLFQYLLLYDNKDEQELFIERFFDHFTKGVSPIQAISKAVNSLVS